ncbi:MAG: TetR/AcrR family transcriptional regulator [Hydrococcus sp. Prado102]|nr:TetR/AcrR family transcriptional regulator [Hydrococcus sp. Prado102]
MRKKPQQARSQERVKRILDEAERLFLEMGYEATTTKAIALKAEIPIGTLYQFFPNRAAIAVALAVRYAEQLQQLFSDLHTTEATRLPLKDYLNRTVDTFHEFYAAHPGLIIIFGQLRQTAPEIQKVNMEFDLQIEQQVAEFFCRCNPKLDVAQAELIAKVASDTIRVLQTSALATNDRTLREQILTEAKKLLFNYLQPYLCNDSSQLPPRG